MENHDPETNQDKYTLLPSTKFTSRPVYKGNIICKICFASSSIKNLNRSNLQKISNFKNFMDYVQRWNQYVYDDSIDLTDCNNK